MVVFLERAARVGDGDGEGEDDEVGIGERNPSPRIDVVGKVK